MNSKSIQRLSLTAITLIIASQCTPVAFAETPPAIDNSFLPAPTPPAPPQPTRQLQTCTVLTLSGSDNVTASQFNGIDKAALWRLSRGKGQRIAVIDTGIQPHSRLPQIVAGGDYVGSGDGRQDCDGHGTIVAGIIAASPDPADPTGLSGMAPDATLISIRQSSVKFGSASDHSVTGAGNVATLAMAVRTAADMGASVINLSAVACSESPPDDRALGAALAYSVDVKDAVIVTAAGNVGGSSQCPAQGSSERQPAVIVTPAWYDDYVLTVGSIDHDGKPSSFSLHGPWVDIAAPGENIVSLSLAGSGVIDRVAKSTVPVPISGTSYATPIVAGLAALIRSRFPRLSARQVMARITRTARKPAAGWDSAVGNGIVDPVAALSDVAAAPAGEASPPNSSPSVENSDVPNGRQLVPPTIAAATACFVLLVTVALWPRLSRLVRIRSREVATHSIVGD